MDETTGKLTKERPLPNKRFPLEFECRFVNKRTPCSNKHF